MSGAGNCGAIARLSLPIMVAQLGTIVTGYADTIMVGHFSTGALAASSLVSGLFNLCILLSLGFSYGITPLAGALAARPGRRGLGALLRNALAANALFGLLLLVGMTAIYLLLPRMGQPAELLPLVRTYYLIILASMVPVVVTHVMRQFCDALGHTSLGMWIFTAGNALNIVGNYALIFGHWGAPRLGLTGAGLSTLAARLLMCLAYVACVALLPRYRQVAAQWRASRVQWPRVWQVTRKSLPVSLQMGMETAIFTFASVVAGWLGTRELAAYQVLVMLGSLGYLIYYAFGAGMAIEVARLNGRADRAGIARAVRAGYRLTLLSAVLACAVFLGLGRWVTGIFTADAQVVALAVAIIPYLALYQLADATQVAYANALRGLGLTATMMRCAVAAYVAAGLPLVFLLGHTAPLGLRGIYLAFTLSLGCAALLLRHRFFQALEIPAESRQN